MNDNYRLDRTEIEFYTLMHTIAYSLSLIVVAWFIVMFFSSVGQIKSGRLVHITISGVNYYLGHIFQDIE